MGFKKIFFLFLSLMFTCFNCIADNRYSNTEGKQQLLVKNTMLQLKSLSQSEVNALLSKKYSGVVLYGYYKKGDTPAPIVYTVSTVPYADDNGAVVQVKQVKLYHHFDVCDMSYYGLQSGVNSEEVADLNTRNINAALQKFKKVCIKKRGIYYFRGNRGGEGGSYYRHQDPVYETFWPQVGDGGGQPGGILIPSNRVFEMFADVELRQRPTFMQAYNLITLWGANNVVIRGGKVVGDLDNHDSRDGGEWGYGLSIQGSSNVLVEDLEITKLWGDGINISVDVFNNFKESSDIIFRNVKSTYNRRQGMSICGGKNLRFDNCTFSNTGVTQYTAPGFGVDLENDITDVKLNNITFYKCLFERNYGGARTVHNGNTTNISFIDCIFRNNRTVNYDSYTAGGITFQNCDFGYTANYPFGFEIRSSFDIKFKKCKFYNAVYLGKRNEHKTVSKNIYIDSCTIIIRNDANQFFNFNDSKNITVSNNTIIQERTAIDLKKKWEIENGKNLNLRGNRFK